MITVLNSLRELTVLSVALRMLLAVVCGGVIGLERENKRRPAGFRTHILICLGACMTTLTGQYLSVYMNYHTDMSRLGAQVIAGIGFIGAGTIIVTKRRQVRGLTTAAGLWVTAIIGLCCGAGYFEGAAAGAALVMLAELVFVRLERWLNRNSSEVNLYIKYKGHQSMDGIVMALRERKASVLDLEITRSEGVGEETASAIFLLRPQKGSQIRDLVSVLAGIDGVVLVEQL